MKGQQQLDLYKFSPRTRRCFLLTFSQKEVYLVFSAYAEVFLNEQNTITEKLRFLRVRGGVSTHSR